MCPGRRWRRYASGKDFFPRPAGRAGRTPVDSGYAEIVEGWSAAGPGLPRKQRHTAMRVWQRLRDEHGFEGSYPSERRWVKRWRERHRAESEGYARLAWAPGTAQAGFRPGARVDRGRGTPQRGRHGRADRDVPAVLRTVRVCFVKLKWSV